MKFKKYRMAFYLRKDPGEEDSVNLQQRQLEEFIERRRQFERATIEIYRDNCEPNYYLGPEHERMTQDIKNGKIDIVVVRDIGRIARCGQEFEAFLYLMKEKKFISVEDNLELHGSLDLEFEEKAA